jgi:AraC-like DNA-binding protein
MDPLTQMVQLLRPKGFTWKGVEAGSDWLLRFPATAGISFCLVAAGSCRLDVPPQEPRRLGEGDYVLLAAPPCWTLSDGVPSDSIDVKTALAASQGRRKFVGRRGVAPIARLVGGHFSFDKANAGLLGGLIPAVVVIPSFEPGARRLRGVLDLIDDEARSSRSGRTLILERLLEIMLVEAIRHGAGVGEIRPGLLAGLGDRPVGATLRAMHADIRRGWTVAQLAAVARMSRSVFAERFTRIVGMPPIDYLLHWRMTLAKDALRRRTSSLAEVAFSCGYGSASAFSTAFSRTVGCSPAKYRSRKMIARTDKGSLDS